MYPNGKKGKLNESICSRGFLLSNQPLVIPRSKYLMFLSECNNNKLRGTLIIWFHEKVSNAPPEIG